MLFRSGLPDAIHWSIERRSSGVQVCVRNRMSNCSSIFFYCAYIKKTIEAGGTTWSKTKKNSIYVAEQKNKQEKAFQVFPQEGKRLPDMSFDCTGRNSHNLGYLLTAHIMEIGQTESLCAFGRQFINGEFYDFPQILINNRPKEIGRASCRERV